MKIKGVLFRSTVNATPVISNNTIHEHEDMFGLSLGTMKLISLYENVTKKNCSFIPYSWN